MCFKNEIFASVAFPASVTGLLSKVHEGKSSKGKAPAVEREGTAPRPVDDFAQLLQQQAKVHGEQIQQLLEMQRTTHEQAQTQAIVHRHVPVQTDVYDRFRRLNPPEFMGSTDTAVAEEWIKSLESIFSYLHMDDHYKKKAIRQRI